MKLTKKIYYRLIVLFGLMLLHISVVAQTVTVRPLWSNGVGTTYAIDNGSSPSRFARPNNRSYNDNLYTTPSTSQSNSTYTYVAKPTGTAEYHKDVQKVIAKHIKETGYIPPLGQLNDTASVKRIINDFVNKYNYPKEPLLKDIYLRYGYGFIFNNDPDRIH